MILRYLLYGRDAVNDGEFDQLISLGYVQKLGEKLMDVKIKSKSVKKGNQPSKNKDYNSDMDGEGDCVYKKQFVPVYQDNSVGDPFKNNFGFKV